MVVIVDDESDTIGGRHGGPRPGTAISETSDDGLDQIQGFMPEGRATVRPRKSSDTLGCPPNMTCKDQDASTTDTFYQRPRPMNPHRRGQRSSSSSPARPSPYYEPSGGMSRNSPFPGMLSRGSTPFGSESGHPPPPREPKDDSGPPSRGGEGRTETPLPSWPLPPYMSTAPRKKREHQIYVPPAIPETSLERGLTRGREDGETSSTRSRFSNRSRGSAFTVRIEEED
ncbi:hypothetical protein XA68_14007 [Ophiocordyceps unilateralis]|uniref:Uncharacterized protein n=1 Tax=Ophiocordyceps unilateralis TaxID=268505 RepID=A0A2A9PAB0_OPHUN|nr:hypothetical protein XA68_14007 [Ophiocordyceps unilateralis]